jgi:NADH-quinone oxidoreductase subunit H
MNSTAQDILLFVQTWWVELVCALFLVVAIPLVAGYAILAHRKLLVGLLNRSGSTPPRPLDLLRPITRAFMLLIKREAVPAGRDALIFWVAPIASMLAALTSLGALYFGPSFTVARDINIGILFIVGLSSFGFLGIFGGGASTQPYHLTGALCSTAQLVTYSLAASLALISALLLCGTLKIHAIVEAQSDQRVWFIFLAPFGFFIYPLAAILAINRRPFQLPEGESKPAGSASGYGGFRSTLYFLGEYAGMIVVASIAATLFLGGWLRPFPNVHWLNWLDNLPALLMVVIGVYCIYRAGRQPAKIQSWFVRMVALGCFAVAVILLLPRIFVSLRFAAPGINGAFWFLFKIFIYLPLFVWLRSTLPLWRFDQLVHLAWRILIPLATVNIFFVAFAMLFEWEFGWNRWLAMILANILTLCAAIFLVHLNDERSAAADSAMTATSGSHAG